MGPTTGSTSSADRVEPGSVSIPLAAWPRTYTTPPPETMSLASTSPPDGKPGTTTAAATTTKETALVDADGVATQLTAWFNKHLSSADHAAVAELFVAGADADGDVGMDSSPAPGARNTDPYVKAFWRDHLAVRWDMRTVVGRDAIERLLSGGGGGEAHNLVGVEIDRSTDFARPQLVDLDRDGTCVGVRFFVTLRTKVGRGRGIVRLVQVPGGVATKDTDVPGTAGHQERWKIWTLFTTLESLAGHEEPRGVRRPLGVRHGAADRRKNWLERRAEEVEFRDRELDVLIVGAGQAGLSVAARLKMLSVPTLIIDANQRIGDNWRKRYRQLVLHDAVWYDHMPYLDFPDWWPVFTPKDKLADWFEAYARLLELDVWTESTILQGDGAETEGPRWDAARKQWAVTVERSVLVGDGVVRKERRVLYPKHIIQATGHAGKPYMPDIPGMDTFKGDLLCHSSAFPGAATAKSTINVETCEKPTKRVVIVGACNSAHDIAQDYVESGRYASVTMLQRSSTCVVTSQTLVDVLLGANYNEGSPATVEEADAIVWSMPMAMLKSMHRQVTTEQQRRDRPLLDSLAASGFALDDGPDGCGLFIKYIQRGGGYYIDVGASALITSGKIKVLSGPDAATVVAVTPRGVRLADGNELEADEVVFATGYGNMRGTVAGVVGPEAAERVGDVWGFDAEKGEFRGLWRPGGGGRDQGRNGQDGFWLHGGNLAICRYYSRLLALQIKARLEGLVE